MPSNKKRNRNRNKKRRQQRQINSNIAPTMNGMQQVSTWALQDLFPIGASQGFDTANPVIVEVFAGVNEWGYLIKQGTAVIGSSNYPYGQLANQFAELAQLWSTYRIDGLMVEWSPAQTGAGFHSPIATCLDPAGSIASVGVSDFNDLIITFSRLRSMKIHSSLARKTAMNVDYRNWIMQTCPQAFLQTVDPNNQYGERVFYPSGSVNTSPVIRMAAQIVLGPGISERTPLGYLRICARMSVRGRRGLPLSGTQLVMLMPSADKKLVHEYLDRLHKQLPQECPV